MSVRQRPPQRGAVGQHFLRSSRLAADIVAQAEVARGDLIVEVGGGTGALTQPLVRTGATVIAIERDPALAARLRRRFERDTSLTVVDADAASYCWPREPFAVVANLPFAASGAILAGLLRDPLLPLSRADVIVQWEFAAKHAAVWPATLRSSHWRAWYDVSIVRRLASNGLLAPAERRCRGASAHAPAAAARAAGARRGLLGVPRLCLRRADLDPPRSPLVALAAPAQAAGSRARLCARRSAAGPRRRAVGAALRSLPPRLSQPTAENSSCRSDTSFRRRGRARRPPRRGRSRAADPA